ncbi:MAG TPA: non-homologous end-joining DNA ligase [Terriglobales bacterium]|nr:non-homologous end-joining DNA ligase [Terriglobales bacterium]
MQDAPSAKPAFIPPMECKLVRSLPDQPHWLLELKLDGYRAIAVKSSGKADLFSRYRRSFKERFGRIAAALDNMNLEFVLDGEIVALDDQGRPNFQELQNSRSTRQPIVYYVFDLLNYGDKDLRYLPLRERKRALEVLAKEFSDPVRLATAVNTDARTLLAEVKKLGLEGVVAKDPESYYESGKRSGRWLKYRLNQREEFLIGGYRPGTNYVDAILVGRFEGTKLMFVEKVRNGFTRESRKQVFEALQDLVIPECPFANLPERSKRRGAVDAEQMKRCVWVRPEQKCEIEFAEWTRERRLRHPAFRQLTRRTRPRSQAV